MAKALHSVGNVFLFLAGMAAGILLSIYGIAAGLAEGVNVDKLNPIFLLPYTYYVAAIVMMVALSVLLRRAARQVV